MEPDHTQEGMIVCNAGLYKRNYPMNGEKFDETTLDEMHETTFSLSETLDIGIDNGTPVSNKYSIKNHFPYTGELDKVIVKLTD